MVEGASAAALPVVHAHHVHAGWGHTPSAERVPGHEPLICPCPGLTSRFPRSEFKRARYSPKTLLQPRIGLSPLRRIKKV